MERVQEGKIRVGILGAGGLGKAAAQIIGLKSELRLCAICDSHGIISASGVLSAERIASLSGDLVTGYRKSLETSETLGGGVSVLEQVEVRHCDDSVGEMIAIADSLDAILIALPNLPNDFIPNVIKRFVQAKKSIVFVDVLKRTRAVELMFEMDSLVKDSRSVVLTGCGATPGFLAAAAVLAAQSFITIENVKIRWGVGISNWDAYRATIREDIAHLPGYSVEKAESMTDQEINELLEKTDGLLELRNMEHADDLLLKRVGVVDDSSQVEVGGIMDTRHSKKPVSTTMTLTGTTFDGKRSSHQFILGDETSMAANVIGPALGYLKRGLWLKEHGLSGVFGCTEFLPMIVR